MLVHGKSFGTNDVYMAQKPVRVKIRAAERRIKHAVSDKADIDRTGSDVRL